MNKYQNNLMKYWENKLNISHKKIKSIYKKDKFNGIKNLSVFQKNMIKSKKKIWLFIESKRNKTKQMLFIIIYKNLKEL